MSLLLQAAVWLRAEKNCPLVLTERTPRYGHGQPDVLGITDFRYLLEIEIKESVSDFRANANKYHIKKREELGDGIAHRFPKQFWFLVPPKLVDKVLPEVPKWAGLLTVKEDKLMYSGWSTAITSVKKAPVNNLSKKISIKEASRLLRAVGNELFSLRIANNNMKRSGYHLDPHHMDSFYSTKLEFDGVSKHQWVPNPDYLNFQI